MKKYFVSFRNQTIELSEKDVERLVKSYVLDIRFIVSVVICVIFLILTGFIIHSYF